MAITETQMTPTTQEFDGVMTPKWPEYRVNLQTVAFTPYIWPALLEMTKWKLFLRTLPQQFKDANWKMTQW